MLVAWLLPVVFAEEVTGQLNMVVVGRAGVHSVVEVEEAAVLVERDVAVGAVLVELNVAGACVLFLHREAVAGMLLVPVDDLVDAQKLLFVGGVGVHI